MILKTAVILLAIGQAQAGVTLSEEAQEALSGRSKAEIFLRGVEYRKRWLDAVDDRDIARARLRAANRMLATRTSTAIRSMVVPPKQEAEGPSPLLVVSVIAGVLLAGLAVGYAIGSNGDPAVVVATASP